MYDTKEEANQKLASTVILFKGTPCIVQEASGRGTKVSLSCQFLKSKETFSESILNPEFEFRNFGDRIGYVNVDMGDSSWKEATYTSRMAVRQAHQTQGISQRNLRIPNLKGSRRLSLPQTSVNWNGLYQSPGFIDMLERRYPTAVEIRSEFEKNMYLTSKAFNRQFAIRRHDIGPYYLEYKGKDVGYTEDFFSWKIAKEFKYLSESLENINFRITHA